MVESLARFLHVSLMESDAKDLRLAEPADLRRRPADHRLRVYLAETKPTRESLADPLQPGRWGWVQFDLPVEASATLHLGTIAAKSDWHDADTGRHMRDEAALKLYARIFNVVRRSLRGPMWVRNVKTGAARRYRDLWYSEGARAWVEQGGLLRQEGVANSEFLIADPGADETNQPQE